MTKVCQSTAGYICGPLCVIYLSASSSSHGGNYHAITYLFIFEICWRVLFPSLRQCTCQQLDVSPSPPFSLSCIATLKIQLTILAFKNGDNSLGSIYTLTYTRTNKHTLADRPSLPARASGRANPRFSENLKKRPLLARQYKLWVRGSVSPLSPGLPT